MVGCVFEVDVEVVGFGGEFVKCECVELVDVEWVVVVGSDFGGVCGEGGEIGEMVGVGEFVEDGI